RIVLGIGNPGPEYEPTRHNIGFMVLDHLAQRLGLAFARLERQADDGSRSFSGKVKARVCEGRRKGRSFLLCKPQTYVNLSGEVAAPLLRHAQRQPDSLFVIVDDLNLPLGRMRIRPSGSAGGHNGLKSIQQSLGSDAFPRLRLGIGQPACNPEGDQPEGERGRSEGLRPANWSDYVLAPFLPEEREVLGRVLGRAADCAQAWLDGQDLQDLMGTYNSSSPKGSSQRGSSQKGSTKNGSDTGTRPGE
ncbi:MAG: aminoacyl-tRNA hydrolase, partial [Planctomycetota bacterium]|nr:aminoacyl-tRNA hydrolase [Planctomycetota bacterium]